jgi:hypothetical protein
MTKQPAPKQLVLVDTPRAWRLDERTRELGREGIARARAALRDGLRQRPTADPPPPGPPPPPPGRRRRDLPHGLTPQG